MRGTIRAIRGLAAEASPEGGLACRSVKFLDDCRLVDDVGRAAGLVFFDFLAGKEA